MHDTLLADRLTTAGVPHPRARAEIVGEVEWLCHQVTAEIARAGDPEHPSPQADLLRARAIGILWAAGLHAAHAEAWVDATIDEILLDGLVLER